MVRRVVQRLCPLALLATVCSGFAIGGSAAAQSTLDIAVVGSPETVFRHSDEACEREDIPDTPARAIRRDDGQVVLYASHWRNRTMVGTHLLRLRRDCAVVLDSAQAPNPAQMNDRSWIVSPWTADGRTVFSLVHMEYQGHRFPQWCRGTYQECWYNVITLAVSRDGGRNFRPAGERPTPVMAVPEPFSPEARRPVGFFNPTNIVRHDGYWYVLVLTTGSRIQPRGTCLVRTDRLDEPAAWRGWDGTGFNVAFGDPYRGERPTDQPFTCKAMPRSGLPFQVMSLVRHATSGLFIAVMHSFGRAMDGRPAVSGVWLSTSRDLLAWSPPKQILEAPNPFAEGCPSGRPAFAYPSLLDPEAPDRNFETVGPTAELFMTRFNPSACGRDLNRDLVRWQVRIRETAER